MSPALIINTEWERTDGGDPEEQASFGLLRIANDTLLLTEGYDEYVRRLRDGPLVSAYHAAEWLAWNWWRLRWEPQTTRPDWPFAHQMETIGHGYIWSNITIRSDGARIALIAKSSADPEAKPFRYIADHALIVGGAQFQTAVDRFIIQVLDRLTEEKVGETNLERLWRDLARERIDPNLALRRRLEALTGSDPDEAGVNLDSLMADTAEIGNEAVAELAAHEGATQIHHTLVDLRAQAQTFGYEMKLSDTASLAATGELPGIGEAPAWKRGAAAAAALRKQECLGAEPISSARLAEMTGLSSHFISGHKTSPDISFMLSEKNLSRIVLHSKWDTGRRFELARLLGDRLAVMNNGKLRPATRSRTYRQQTQRSFAAELLSPFEAVDEMMDGDYSAERQQNVAEYYNVSPLTINSLLKNHGRLERDDPEQDDSEAPAAA